MKEEKNRPSDIRLVNFNKYIRPVVEEVQNKEWIMNGQNNSFYNYIIERYNGSPTNAAIINSYTDLIYGRGLWFTNGESSTGDWLKFRQMLSDEDLKRVISDFALFGEASMQIIKKNSSKNLPNIHHIPKQYLLPEKKAKSSEAIKQYYYSDNWEQVRTVEQAEKFPVFKGDAKAKEVYVIRPYKAGKKYFSDPDYLAGMPYAELEEEIANYYISHIKNGMSFGYIVNIPDGNSYNAEEKDELEKKIKLRLTGSPNAGKFLINFNGRDAEITITTLTVADAHKQWQYLTGESRQQLLTAHRVTSPMLFGIKDATGFGNNAEELDTAEAQLMKRVIQPKQQYILDALMDIARFYNLNLNLVFKPLTDPDKIIIPEKKTNISFGAQDELNKLIDNTANFLVDLGEEIDDVDWELLEEREVESHTLSEDKLISILKFTSVIKSSPSKVSEQDTSLFKIRYFYAGNQTPEREFCKKMISAGKVYRVEDIEKASNKVINKGFGPNGTDTYDAFLYKGGVNCKHFWERRIYLRKNNKRIGVNQARKLILQLEPKDRDAAKWDKNPKEVAVIASPSNNNWSLK